MILYGSAVVRPTLCCRVIRGPRYWVGPLEVLDRAFMGVWELESPRWWYGRDWWRLWQ